MKYKVFKIAGTAIGVALTLGLATPTKAQQVRAEPPAVLVELFTSEGCSSCPPADAFLETLDQSSAVSGATPVVLSEHVDYWNHGGWRDPYSAAQFSERQTAYAERFGLQEVYTPQIVVNGGKQLVGNDARNVRAAIGQAAREPKATIKIVPLDSGSSPRVRVEVKTASNLPGAAGAQVYLAVASNETNSEVSAGENSGRHLHHVAVVRSLKRIGAIDNAGSFQKDLSVDLGQRGDATQTRLVAFLQERNQGRVLGSSMTRLSSPEITRP